MKIEQRARCSWATTDLYKEYHDKEWGKPVHNDDKLFEMLILEGMQAGLSWLTILNKREEFRKAFDRFDCRKVTFFSPPGILSSSVLQTLSLQVVPLSTSVTGRTVRLGTISPALAEAIRETAR